MVRRDKTLFPSGPPELSCGLRDIKVSFPGSAGVLPAIGKDDVWLESPRGSMRVVHYWV